MQVIITHILVFMTLLFLQIIHKLTGLVNFKKICHYIYLSNNNLYTRPWTLLTHFFLHRHFTDLLFNLLWLHSFGRVIVHLLGSKKFLTLYLPGGIIGGITFVLSYNFLPFFAKINEHSLQNATAIHLIGGSAALYAVIAGLATFAPNFSFSFFPFISVKIKHIALIFIIWSVWNLSYSEGEEGIHIARLGGALWGYLYIQYLFLYNNKKWRVWLNQIYINFKKRQPIFPQPTQKPANTSTLTKEAYTNISNEEIEAILDKIALYGYEKLTQEEKRKLFHGGEN